MPARSSEKVQRPVTAGYSGKPLIEKLGMKPGMRVFLINAPDNYSSILGPFPEGTLLIKSLRGPLDLIHLFTVSVGELDKNFARARKRLASNGALWVSWPKRSSGVKTDVNENVVRKIGLAQGLVDVKICAVDEMWSGLKFVYRLKDRK
ncbi:MAG TPA: DUF3052 domain-containing protein [Blastocatellia bacterium]|nr:DUF3052 domain-containing protein [Blastocatellia bacterium]